MTKKSSSTKIPATKLAPTKFSFTDKNKKKAEEILSKYPKGKKSALLPLLDLAQRQAGGWLPAKALEYVADYINLPYIKIHEVASFYSMFNLTPVGKYHIQICGTTPCWLRGAKDIITACEKITNLKSGETNSEFTITEVECLAACVNAPVAQINDDYYEDLTENKIKEIIEKIK